MSAAQSFHHALMESKSTLSFHFQFWEPHLSIIMIALFRDRHFLNAIQDDFNWLFQSAFIGSWNSIIEYWQDALIQLQIYQSYDQMISFMVQS